MLAERTGNLRGVQRDWTGLSVGSVTIVWNSDSTQGKRPELGSGRRAPAKPGRKPKTESRASEIRQKLLAWKQAPQSQRISLRALAVQLGTSHQLLSVYLKGLYNWQKKDFERRAKAIRTIAWAEKRHMTAWEQSQVKSLEEAASRCMMESVLVSTLKRYEAELRKWETRDSLTRSELKFVRIIAQHGVPIAQKLLKKHQI